MVGAKERVRILEMSSSMIWFQVSILEEAMEIDPPLTDLTSEGDSTDSEYQDVDDGGAVLVEDCHRGRFFFFFFSHFTAQLSTLSSFLFPLSPYETIQDNDEATMNNYDCLF
jgi:hypothetical protein